MKRIFVIIVILGFVSGLQAATKYKINSDTNWSTSLPSYCGNCTINIASGATLTLNNSSMCDHCTITGGTIKITSGFSFQSTAISNTSINATSSFTLNNSNSFSGVTAVISGSSSFTSNGSLSIANSTFTFQNTASFTSNALLNLDASILYFNDNSNLLSNSSKVNLSNGSKIVAGDGSKTSKAYLVFYGQLNLVDASSFVIISNINNYYLSWNTYTSASNGVTYTTTSNNKNCGAAGQNSCSMEKYFGGASLSSTGPVPSTILASAIGDLKISVLNNNSVKLSWTLSGATGGEYFQVERSNDAQNFTPLLTLPAGQLNGTYNYTDESPHSGENDYRVKLTGTDGIISYSKIISEQTTGKENLSLFPNPCTNGNIQIRLSSVQSVRINAFAIDGRLLYMGSLSGQSSYALNIPGTVNTHILVIQVITKERTSTFYLINN